MTFAQEPHAQIQSSDNKEVAIVQEPLAQIQDVAQTVAAAYQIAIEDIEKLFLASPVARINWASHVILLNSSLPLGVDYWYMKQSVEMGWSSILLKRRLKANCTKGKSTATRSIILPPRFLCPKATLPTTC